MKKIDRIILFGDSFIQGTGCFNKLESDGRMVYEDGIDNRDPKLIQFQNYEAYTKNLLEYFPNVEVINFGRDGYSNYESFDKLNNYFQKDYRQSDLILFGFTSKFRDFSKSTQFIWNTYPYLLNEENPLIHNPLAWDKRDFDLNKNYWARNHYPEYDEAVIEKDLTNKFLIDYTNHIHNDYFLEYIAKTNYIFIQNWVESNEINFHCFDLFENYVVGNIGNFEINTDIYINYNNHRNESMLFYLINNEHDGIDERFSQHTVSFFESNNSFINTNKVKNTELVHPNQFGYEKYVNYLCEEFLIKKYK